MLVDDFKIMAINHYGTGGHPVAAKDNLHLFGADYVLECTRLALASGRLSEAAEQIAREVIGQRNGNELRS